MVVLATLCSVEVLARANYALHHRHLPFFSSGRDFIYRFYPELRPALQPERAAEGLRVLLLGGSTLHPEFGDIAERLADRLQERFQQPIRMVNLAMPAQGVLDCDYKYRFLRQRRFDVVALYVGMNDVRANNVPDTLWRDDYGHYCWYDELSFFMRHQKWTRWNLLTPFFVKALAIRINQRLLHRAAHVSRHSVNPEWIRFGGTIKTAKPFRAAIERIVTLAETKGEPLILMTFAHHLPKDYSRERLRDGSLDYIPSPQASPVELWGAPANVQAGLTVHNQIIREVAQRHPAVIFIDQDQLMSHQGRWFIDVCHLSPAGSAEFVANIMAELQKRQSGIGHGAPVQKIIR